MMPNEQLERIIDLQEQQIEANTEANELLIAQNKLAEKQIRVLQDLSNAIQCINDVTVETDNCTSNCIEVDNLHDHDTQNND